MCSICVVGRTYEQTYPQNLGREFCGTNILDASREKAVDKPVLRLSTDFPGDRSGIRNFLGSMSLLMAGLLLGFRKGGFWSRECY